MIFRKLLAVVFSLILIVLPSIVNAGTAGKIAGSVTDASTGEPVIGVNLILEGTRLGTATDLDGFYYILNIPPGVYTLTVSAVGYANQTIIEIRVRVDQTTKIDIELEEQILEGEVVVVRAKRPIVEIDRTFATSTVDAQDLSVMPIIRVQEAIDIQAGVVDGHFRGGRSGEVVYMVDGVPVQDSYDNTQATTVNQGAVQELQVISGAFNAEYGQAMSGVVNLVTKEGGESYSARGSMHLGDYFSDHDDIFLGIDDISPTAIQDYEFSLSGPVPGVRDFNFFFNGRWEDSKGWYFGERRWALEHPVMLTDSGFVAMTFDRDSLAAGDSVWVPGWTPGDGSTVPMNPDKRTYLYGKLNTYLTPSLKLTYSSLWEDRNYRDYDHAYKFIPDGDYQRFRHSRTNMIRLTNALSSAAYLEFGFSNSFTEYYHWTFSDIDDPRYVSTEYLDANPSYTMNIGGTQMERFRRFTDTSTFQGKFSWQVDQRHYLVGGFSYSMHDIFYKSVTLRHDFFNEPMVIDPYTPAPLRFVRIVEGDTSIYVDDYLYHPMEMAGYLQDKIELKSLIVNIGLRFDYFDPAGKIPSDPLDPDISHPLLIERQQQTMAEREEYWYNDSTPKTQISPRLGIGYPISPTGVLHFAYGHFFQRPRYEYLYTNPEFELEGSGLNTVIGNANLKAEKTISYEFGLEQGISEDIAVGISLYQRDIRNLVSTDEIIATYEAGTKYAHYTNRDFGEIRGVILTFDKRYSNNVSAGIDYTFQVAQGNASDPQDAYNAQKGESNSEPIKQLLPLDWDRRHTLNVNVNYVVPDNWGVSVIGVLGSGLPYTTEQQGLQAGFENDGRKPLYWNVDINAFKEIPVFEGYKMTFELMVRNLFDRLNENDVFRDTGRATYTDLPNVALEVEEINTFDEYFTHPEYYSRPREVRFGVSFMF